MFKILKGFFCKAFRIFKTPLYSSEYWTVEKTKGEKKNGLFTPLTLCNNIAFGVHLYRTSY